MEKGSLSLPKKHVCFGPLLIKKCLPVISRRWQLKAWATRRSTEPVFSSSTDMADCIVPFKRHSAKTRHDTESATDKDNTCLLEMAPPPGDHVSSPQIETGPGAHVLLSASREW